MKVILSRKGFDSRNGKIPSPIMPDGTLLSLPVPENPKVSEKVAIIKYEQLQYKGKSYAEIINELKKIDFLDERCHLDPDICESVITRSENWRPAFGQSNAAITHLRKTNGVGINDLFLFFGWFRKVEIDGKYQYMKKSVDQHVIFGYLQVGEILEYPIKEQYPGLEGHPHLDRGSKSNTIFVARKSLSWDENKPGAGCLNLNCNPELVLTKEGFSRTRWQLPDFLKKVKISYHTEENWKENYFQSADIGQEFVIDSDGKEKVEQWAKDFINKGLTT